MQEPSVRLTRIARLWEADGAPQRYIEIRTRFTPTVGLSPLNLPSTLTAALGSSFAEPTWVSSTVYAANCL